MAIDCQGGLVVGGGIFSRWKGENALHLYPKPANQFHFFSHLLASTT